MPSRVDHRRACRMGSDCGDVAGGRQATPGLATVATGQQPVTVPDQRGDWLSGQDGDRVILTHGRRELRDGTLVGLCSPRRQVQPGDTADDQKGACGAADQPARCARHLNGRGRGVLARPNQTRPASLSRLAYAPFDFSLQRVVDRRLVSRAQQRYGLELLALAQVVIVRFGQITEPVIEIQLTKAAQRCLARGQQIALLPVITGRLRLLRSTQRRAHEGYRADRQCAEHQGEQSFYHRSPALACSRSRSRSAAYFSSSRSGSAGSAGSCLLVLRTRPRTNSTTMAAPVRGMPAAPHQIS